LRKAEDLIQRFLDSIGQSDGAAYVSLFGSWTPIVGERISAHAQPVDLRGHTLIVEADHPGWVQMVMMKRSRIIGELTRRFPELGITGLAVRVAEQPGRAAPARAHPEDTPPRPPVPAAPPSRDEAEALERISDDDLRETLERLRNDLDS
jgi:hypothetical protein